MVHTDRCLTVPRNKDMGLTDGPRSRQPVVPTCSWTAAGLLKEEEVRDSDRESRR